MQTLIGKMKINIAGGSGIMGKVHKPIFESAGYEVIISGRTSSPSLEEAAKISDLTIVSVPIPATEEIIKRVAPYCSALMDFTGLKVFPIKAMMEYSNENCEVGGLHPLYGERLGRTVVYCPTNRSGDRCNMVIDAFEKSGVKIKKMDAQSHDLFVGGIAQNARLILFEAFAGLLERYNLSAEDLYEISPPPTKILLDLLSRQVDERYDSLYKDMRDYNPSTKEITQYLANVLNSPRPENTPKKIRALFGESLLKEAQNKARLLIDKSNK